MQSESSNHTQTHPTRMFLFEKPDEAWHEAQNTGGDSPYQTTAGCTFDSLEEYLYRQRPHLTGNNMFPVWNKRHDHFLVRVAAIPPIEQIAVWFPGVTVEDLQVIILRAKVRLDCRKTG